MMGDRFGDVVKTTRNKAGVEIAHVRLDLSNKTIRVPLDDCTLMEWDGGQS